MRPSAFLRFSKRLFPGVTVGATVRRPIPTARANGVVQNAIHRGASQLSANGRCTYGEARIAMKSAWEVVRLRAWLRVSVLLNIGLLAAMVLR